MCNFDMTNNINLGKIKIDWIFHIYGSRCFCISNTKQFRWNSGALSCCKGSRDYYEQEWWGGGGEVGEEGEREERDWIYKV